MTDDLLGDRADEHVLVFEFPVLTSRFLDFRGLVGSYPGNYVEATVSAGANRATLLTDAQRVAGAVASFPATLDFFAYDMALFFRPIDVWGQAEVKGDIELSAFGIGVGLSADETLQGETPKPFFVDGELHVKLSLPWPLPDLEADVHLHWEVHIRWTLIFPPDRTSVTPPSLPADWDAGLDATQPITVESLGFVDGAGIGDYDGMRAQYPYDRAEGPPADFLDILRVATVAPMRSTVSLAAP